MRNTVFYIALIVVLLMHTVGLCGILFLDPRGRNDYIELSWVNLLVTGIAFIVYSIALYVDTKNLQRYLLVFAGVCVVGFLVEVLGIKTGKIFGIYHYGDRLGYRFLQVPLIIGLNWGLLVFSVAAITSRLKTNYWIKAWTGATLLVMLDLLIEPVATRFFYWTWDIKIIPVQNFIAWWVVSFLLLVFCFRFVRNMQNQLGIFVYLIQLVFFSLLLLFIQ